MYLDSRNTSNQNLSKEHVAKWLSVKNWVSLVQPSTFPYSSKHYKNLLFTVQNMKELRGNTRPAVCMQKRTRH